MAYKSGEPNHALVFKEDGTFSVTEGSTTLVRGTFGVNGDSSTENPIMPAVPTFPKVPSIHSTVRNLHSTILMILRKIHVAVVGDGLTLTT